MCGYDEAVKDYPMLYFTNFKVEGDFIDNFNTITRSGVCMKKCPNGVEVADDAWWTANCKSNTNVNTPCPTAAKHDYSSF